MRLVLKMVVVPPVRQHGERTQLADGLCLSIDGDSGHVNISAWETYHNLRQHVNMGHPILLSKPCENAHLSQETVIVSSCSISEETQMELSATELSAFYCSEYMLPRCHINLVWKSVKVAHVGWHTRKPKHLQDTSPLVAGTILVCSQDDSHQYTHTFM